MNRYFGPVFMLTLVLTCASIVSAQTTRSPDPNPPAQTETVGASLKASDPKEKKAEGANASAVSDESSITDPLIRLLISKRLLSAEEARTVVDGPASEERYRLAALLRDKGVISAAEFQQLQANAAGAPSTVASVTANYKPSAAEPPPAAAAPQATRSTVIPAVAPIRLLGIDTPKREGLIPDIKLGTGARLKLYGFFKTSIIHDSSSPQGNDFPLPLLAADTGPNNSPEFHLRARGLRLGANFEWLDIAPKTTITGKIEFDFEGDFTRVNNRNISSIRSSQPSIRLAWVRIDRRFNDKTSAFALFGQDWSPFVSSTMPNMIENTNFGGLGYGAAYTRIPQARFGFNYSAGGSRSVSFGPEIAIVLPAFGNLPADVANQLGFGERQGADSEQPGVQGRAVLQWQLDRAENVSPAQFIVSFEHARRKAIVTAANVPAAFSATFPSGAEISSSSNGYSVEIQLPTHFVTVVTKYYNGSDLRFFFAGQFLSNFNDTAGLTSTVSAASIDGSSTVVFGLLNGIPVVAPQRPVRGQGGFIQLGFPLSRLFDADPKGRNAGWTAFLYYGGDQATARDARRFGARGAHSDLFSGNIQYKWNQWVTFAYEQGYYRTRANNRVGLLPLFRGIPSFTTHNIRSEFAAIFSF
jgi:hypothetical protein